MHCFEENQVTTLKKKSTIPNFGLFWPKFGQKWIFHKNLPPSSFSIFSPLTSCKKLELISQFTEKLFTNRQTNRQTNNWMNGNKWMNKQINEQMNEQTNEHTNKWKEQTNKRTYGQANGQTDTGEIIGHILVGPKTNWNYFSSHICSRIFLYCVYFPCYSLKCISCFMLRHLMMLQRLRL